MNIKFLLIIPTAALVLSACNTSTNTDQNQEFESESDAMVKDSEVMESTESGEAMEGGIMMYTLTDIAQHSTPEDCWIAIEGKVYDVSPYTNPVNQHPGGPALYKGCGVDGTDLYNDRPNGSGEHSDDARSLLPEYLIGDLVE